MGILPPRKDRLIDDVIHFTEQACILVALTFALAHADLVARQLRRGRSTRGSFAALLVFMGTALLVEVVAQRHAPAGAQTVAACAAGLLAGPWVGGTVGVGAVLLALALPMTESAPGLAAVFGGLAGGMIRRVWPAWGQRPLVGFILGLTASLGRHAIAAALVRTGSTAGLGVYDATLNGLGVALVLAVVAEVRAREDEARAASLAEIRALQARMHPHFLFNAMNSIAALSVLAPESVPVAISRLAQFLRWSFDWHDRPTVTLREELEVVDAYLDVEALRLGNRLVVERRVDSEVVEATVPPLSIQPLVENAVRHGLQPCAEGGRILLEACAEGTSLVIIVADTGMGIIQASTMRPASPNDDGAAHALTLLERRLRQIYDGTASLNVCGRPGGGTTVTLRLPLEVPPPPRESLHDPRCGR
ncbi:sensor histidine kinase [Singulisphaera acidiphila]|uniref:sensor histidine kinase n=2 Tax=Singulisphaera acidiphila TaxID=466153 RepID=UPI00143AD2DB|nr:histidine kinase [Singulisphaera acidiphila]